jgi:hypothetical protein
MISAFLLALALWRDGRAATRLLVVLAYLGPTTSQPASEELLLLG